ncbi:hypothetical protein SKAU_G00252830 [Synaphobranchus kaupii]|uniref:Uncharacterized protein n=1 Tax=Synaphobranchus kaupii TaxID=118154 RepID=A0A9Q1IRS5_SYNKA|nr:hypothetical protein SKAU_G00252830 [Synaphobranchus kaupii]
MGPQHHGQEEWILYNCHGYKTHQQWYIAGVTVSSVEISRLNSRHGEDHHWTTVSRMETSRLNYAQENEWDVGWRGRTKAQAAHALVAMEFISKQRQGFARLLPQSGRRSFVGLSLTSAGTAPLR